ncbi:CHASE2 domain-containing protein [Amorphus coralli]|uniref:CHASE2 domain-containing protein n=1 Tax=Amorphus coralli TaxID=340680 RepID=UPI000428FE20|nr:adenylate/guanylate cyclase domain-containing protein [Amorphus coralli]
MQAPSSAKPLRRRRLRRTDRRARIAVALVAIAIMAGALVLRFADPSLLTHLRNLAFDEYQRLAPRTYDPTLPVRIVAIDEVSLGTLGQWPWPRERLAEIAARLTDAGAAAIAFDLALSEPDRSSPAVVLRRMPESAERNRLLADLPPEGDGDRLLADTLASTPTVLGLILTNAETDSQVPAKSGFASAGDDPKPFLPHFSAVTAPLEPLADNAAGLGAMNWIPDRDQIIRTVPLLFVVDDTVVPGLAAEALRVAQGASTFLARASNASGETAFGQATGVNAIRIGGITVPTGPQGTVRIHYTPTTPERLISAAAIVDGSFDPDAVAGRIVLVGATAPGLLDLRSTPIDVAVPGVEVHAQLLEHVIGGGMLHRPDWASGLETVVFVVLAIVIALSAAYLPVRVSSAIGVVGIAGWCTASWLAYTNAHLLLDPTFPALAAAAVLFATVGFVAFREERGRREIRSAFGRYVAPGLVEELARDPERLRLGGEIRDMTILFTDMRGFTTVSEGMDAERLTAFVNAFLTPLTDTILANRGTIDKYIGDAVMAFWNAPLDDPDHARHACKAALGMLKAIERFNAADHTYPPVAIGIGLNTGACCVGNLGSERRFDYSVIGDDVNVASRLEGQTKAYGVPIIVGEQTARAVPDFALVEFDRVRVKGKTVPISLFALMGDATEATSPAFESLRDAIARLTAAYRAGDIDGADKAVADAEAANGNGRFATIVALYRERLDTLRGHPLPQGWTGIHDLDKK